MVLKEFSNTGHHDPIAVVMSLIAIWYIHRGHRMVGGAFIGLGILGKIYPAVFLVVFHRKLGIRGVVTTVMIVILGYSPFLVSGGFGRSFHGLSAFGNNWESNSSLFALCEKVVWRVTYGKDPEPIRSDDSTDPAAAVRSMPFGLTRAQFVRRTVRLFLGGILFLILLWRARHPQDSLEDLLRSSLIAVGSVVLFSPVALPWYFCWALPYAVVFPRSSFLYLIMSVNLYYVYFWIPPGGAFGYKPWIRAVEYVPFYALLIRDLWVERVRRIAPDEG